MDLNGPTPTCKSAGQRGIGAIVHTEGILEPTSTALKCTKPLGNSPERTRTAITAQVSTQYFREQATQPDLVAPNARTCR